MIKDMIVAGAMGFLLASGAAFAGPPHNEQTDAAQTEGAAEVQIDAETEAELTKVVAAEYGFPKLPRNTRRIRPGLYVDGQGRVIACEIERPVHSKIGRPKCVLARSYNALEDADVRRTVERFRNAVRARAGGDSSPFPGG